MLGDIVMIGKLHCIMDDEKKEIQMTDEIREKIRTIEAKTKEIHSNFFSKEFKEIEDTTT